MKAIKTKTILTLIAIGGLLGVAAVALVNAVPLSILGQLFLGLGDPMNRAVMVAMLTTPSFFTSLEGVMLVLGLASVTLALRLWLRLVR